MAKPLSIVLLMLLMVGCAPQAGPSQPSAVERGRPQTVSRPLQILVGREPASLSLKALGTAGVTTATSRRIFNATLTLVDAVGNPIPYLAASLPQLNSQSWLVSPDGRMETTYPLKPDLVWHDGQPLTAEDFVFTWRVYAVPDLGQAASAPLNSIEEVLAPDAHTLLIRWKRPYPEAGTLSSALPLVPRHILLPAFEQLQSGAMAADAFIRQPYWTSEFVGLGPYKLDRWEPGIALEAVAFDRHVLGNPKIQRIVIGFSGDQNASLARILAGFVDYAADSSVDNAQALHLKKEWATSGGGSTFVKLDFWRGSYAQLRPEMASPVAIMDVRVRQALAYGVDKSALREGLEGLFEGGGIAADAPIVPPTVGYYAEVDRALAKFSYDPRRSAQLMQDAGIAKGTDGFFQGPDGRLRWEIKTNASADNEIETSILASTWRQIGFDFQQATLPASQAQDGQARATFPTLYNFGTSVGENTLAAMNTPGIPRPENRWTGNNRGGWSNATFDRLSDQLTRALEPAERSRLIAQLAAIFSQEVAALPLYFYGLPIVASSAVRGPAQVVQETPFEWNIHEWELTR
jgi:peptide/nickel transport system substrate-binding protein